MTATTRTRLLVCLVAVAVLLPVETILLRAISTPDSQDAVRSWVAGLSTAELVGAADQIQRYPLSYRKEIMRALPADQRSGVWRDHLQTYIDTHPALDETSAIAIQAAMGLLSPAAFEAPDRAVRDQLVLVGEQLTELLGREEAEYLLYRLGPVDGTFVSLEPLTERFANYVRQMVVALAQQDDCECSTSFGCDGQTTHCSDTIGCEPYDDWPACGWGWYQECDGMCKLGMMS